MFTCILVYSFTRLLVYLFTRLLVYSFTCLLVYSFTCILVYSLTNALFILLSPAVDGAGSSGFGAHAAETDVRARLVLVFRRAPSRADNGEGVFPRAAAHGFALQQIGVFFRGVVAQFGVEVGHGLHAGFRVDRAGPFRHVARHVVKAVGVSPVDASARGDEVAVLGVCLL